MISQISAIQDCGRKVVAALPQWPCAVLVTCPGNMNIDAADDDDYYMFIWSVIYFPETEVYL
jgi:hypothetical protein